MGVRVRVRHVLGFRIEYGLGFRVGHGQALGSPCVKVNDRAWIRV